MTIAVEPTLVDERSVDSVVHVLARAFFDDPLIAWLTPEPAARREMLVAAFTPIVRGSRACGEVWTTAGLVSAGAAWMRPGVRDLPAAEGDELVVVSGRFGDVTARRIGLAFPLFGQLREAAVPADHWYLQLLGVEPAWQGQGIGGQVVAPVLARADAAHQPAYLETMKDRNLPFYRALGFEVVETGTLPEAGPRYWTMLRRPG